MKPLLFCADDFGLTPGINAGILDLAERGRLSATSCLSTASHFAQDARKLLDIPIQTGLHLNLSEAVDGHGFYQPLGQLLRRCYLRQLDAQIIRSEIERQFQAFEDALGRIPDYVDGHQHVHQFPIIRDCLFDVLQRRIPNARPWLRSTRPGNLTGLPLSHQLKARFIAALGAKPMLERAHQSGFKSNRHFFGVYGFAGGEQNYLRLLQAWLAAAGSNDLVMCHPARCGNPSDALGPQRVAEYRVLAGSEFPAQLERYGLSLSDRDNLSL